MVEFYMDAHMHFDLYKNRNMVLDYIEKNHSYTIAVTNLPSIYQGYIEKYNKLKYVRIALGYHPQLVMQYPNQLLKFMGLLDSTRYIGEIGLDYSTREQADKIIQYKVFKEIIDNCSGKNKILSIHSRKAVKEILQALKEFDGKVIFHWYSGGVKDLENAIERGYYFSINQQMLKSNTGQNIISYIPLDKVLLESDAPFTRGFENHYSIEFNGVIYQYLAKLYDVNKETIMKHVKSNFIEMLR